MTNEKIIDFDSHEVHKDSNLDLGSNISPEKKKLPRELFYMKEAEQCNLELQCMHFFFAIYFRAFIMSTFDENRNLPKSCNCVRKYCMKKKSRTSKLFFDHFFLESQKNKFLV